LVKVSLNSLKGILKSLKENNLKQNINIMKILLEKKLDLIILRKEDDGGKLVEIKDL
jgi:hypothetical protein